MSIWSKKSIDVLMQEAGTEGENALKRSLTATNLAMLGVGAIIGAGIFVLTGTAAAQHAGPAIVISFVLAGLACGFAGLCYAEFASMIPVAGSAYTYGYATLGELLAWVIGWDLILEYLFGAATVAVGWSGYFVQLLGDFGIHIPEAFAGAPYQVNEAGDLVRTAGAVINLPAVVLVILITGLLVLGIRESARFNNIIVYVKVSIILLVIAFGFFYVDAANWSPFIPEQLTDANGNLVSGRYGWSGILAGAGVIFFAYIGFDAVSTTAQEAINPQRDMPIGILVSLAVCTVLYVLMSLVMTGLVSFEQLDVAEPVYVALDAAGPELAWLKYLTTIGAVAGLASVVLVMLMAQPRIFYAMARDGLLPEAFHRVHPKYKTPWLATIITGSVAAVFAGLFPVGILGHLVSIGTLFAFAIVCAGILVLRYTNPELPRPFKTPFVPVVPALGVVSCLWLMIALPLDTWLRLAIWMAVGFVIYFTYGIRKSKVRGA